MIILALRTLTADCSQTVGRTPLELALKGQYKSLMVKKLKFAFLEQYAKKSIIMVFWVHYCVWHSPYAPEILYFIRILFFS